MSDAATTEMRLCEPYERFPCNQLRSECYRRKLPVIKSGPQANATKKGFMRLLREDDGGNQGETSDARAAVTPPPGPVSEWKERNGAVSAMDPVMELEAAPASTRIVSPPTSPMAFVELPPQRRPRVEVVYALKRDALADCHRNGTEGREKKRFKALQAQEPEPLSDNSFLSTQTSASATSSVNNDPVPANGVVLTQLNKNDTVEDMNMPRWERLHARLEVVNAKLRALYGRRDQWLPCTAGTNDDSDVEFYEMMKRQLQHGLLECVSEA